MFRPLSKKEMDALSFEEHIDYVKQLIEHLNGQIEDTNKSIAEREKWLKNSEPK